MGRSTWNVTLDAQAPGGPHTLQVASEGEEIQLADVMFGDVWICSGQSNMQFEIRKECFIFIHALFVVLKS